MDKNRGEEVVGVPKGGPKGVPKGVLASKKPNKKPTVKEAFERFFDKGPDCWNWKGRINMHGYGQFRQRGAHRWAYELYVGPIPRWHQIDHLCRNTRCVRPDHLEAAMPSENSWRGSLWTRGGER